MQDITQKTITSLQIFLQQALNRRSFNKAILGLSGGIDSAVVAVLCKKAFQNNIKALLMPSTTSSQASIDDSLILCEKFEIPYEILPIQEFDKTFCSLYPNHTMITRGNFCSRMRMATLYHVAQMEERLVIGTSNKSEIMLGYGTIFGDLASAINPIGDLYKTQIYQLANLLDIPQSIIDKQPSADLFEGQNDENDLGYSYAEIDPFLESYNKYNGDLEKLTHFKQEMCKDLIKRIQRNSFKQEMPEIWRNTQE